VDGVLGGRRGVGVGVGDEAAVPPYYYRHAYITGTSIFRGCVDLNGSLHCKASISRIGPVLVR
jgi:hypothetical protein